jgi:uncharacterized metal-binding protein YceD (DUF177 family)
MTPEPEFHRPFAADRVGEVAEQLVEANPAECAALAARLQIPAVLSLSCRFHLRPIGRGTILAEGELRARVRRECVVTLDAFDMKLRERFRVRFVPAGRETNDEDPESDDEISFDGAALDLGEAAAEQLALALDPYPRKPDAVLPALEAEAETSPFAGLARLRRPDPGPG